jgi:hypothetical protein
MSRAISIGSPVQQVRPSSKRWTWSDDMERNTTRSDDRAKPSVWSAILEAHSDTGKMVESSMLWIV